MLHKHVTPAMLKTHLKYIAKTGEMMWRASGKGRRNKHAGTINNVTGYIQFNIFGVRIYTHRAIWAIIYGRWPVAEIDHINGVKNDNRLRNLREATRFENTANARKGLRNKSGYKGVYFSKRAKKWSAQIRHRHIVRWLGHFPTAKAAHSAYCRAANKFFGKFARHA
jgi:hypothetical protein